MDSWRDKVLRYFQPGISRLTLVADPDGLLTEERMLAAIRERGFELIPFDDPIAFRFAYESQYRSVWDRGEDSALVVVLRSAEQQLDHLPFDLLGAGRRIELALHQLFPRLNYAVLASLDRCFLDDIERAGGELDSESLTEKGTREFVLMHCFGIVPSLIRTGVDLMKVLLSLHSRCQQLPGMLLEHLLERMGGHPAFQQWPLRSVLSSREAFLVFVQEQWHAFVTGCGVVGLAAGGIGEVLSGDPLGVAETATATGWRRGADCLIPFAHEDIRAYVDTLFLDGSLTPVVAGAAVELPQWAQPGVVHDEASDSRRRFQGLSRQMEQRLPSGDCSHRDWQEFARTWAELVVLRWSSDQHLEADDRRRWEEL
ncbi:MAG: BREX-3 system phosphatase PglZ, partial [Planctomycetaceae bacterium]